MKKRQIKLAACLLAGAILMTTAEAAPVFASEAEQSLVSQTAGVSLALTDVEGETENILEEEIEEAVRVQELAAQAVAERYSKIGVAQVSDYVNVRSTASEDGEVVGCMENNAVATIVGEENGWYQITSGEISGYVRSDYLVVGDKELVDSVRLHVATVQADVLKVRSEASTESSVLTEVTNGETLDVLDLSTDGWVKISCEKGEGYVSADYVTVSDTYLYAKDQQEVCGGQAVAEYGLQFVGNPYVWGGTSLTNGADCSGFVMSVYARYGVSLPHSSAAMRSVGTEVSYADAQPGDIICYSGHVAIYIGNGQIVHAANERKGITVSSATYANILTVRRIFQ